MEYTISMLPGMIFFLLPFTVGGLLVTMGRGGKEPLAVICPLGYKGLYGGGIYDKKTDIAQSSYCERGYGT